MRPFNHLDKDCKDLKPFKISKIRSPMAMINRESSLVQQAHVASPVSRTMAVMYLLVHYDVALRITIFYFAKEELNCRFVPVFPEAFEPVRVPFQKGLGQRFQQPPGTGIDLGFFELDDLSKPSPGEDVFPLVISAETCMLPHSSDEHVDDPTQSTSAHMQITQAILEKNGNSFQAKVIRQILWVDGVRYELREIYGIGSSAAAEGFDDSDPGKECVICMTEPKDTAVLPCRHM
ncbi:hypothetical protein Godav_015098, partial [Gossypium davidsonii]|nr:hypothetical protein [Gossypium davidsonii]